MRRCSDPDSAWNLVANGVDCGHEVCKNRLDGSAVHPVRLSRSCANSQIVHRREVVRSFHVDYDISCETQLHELVSLNSVGHPLL